jgi:hypothetical protein
VVAVVDVVYVIGVAGVVGVVDVVELQLIAAMTLRRNPVHLQQQQTRSAWWAW